MIQGSLGSLTEYAHLRETIVRNRDIQDGSLARVKGAKIRYHQL